jgi:hypothetical protein
MAAQSLLLAASRLLCTDVHIHALAGRTGKQCRERWHNQLDPGIKKEGWTDEEDRFVPCPPAALRHIRAPSPHSWHPAKSPEQMSLVTNTNTCQTRKLESDVLVPRAALG